MSFILFFCILTSNQGEETRIFVKSADTLKTVDKDKWIAEDKFHHFSYSLGITGLSYHIYHCQFNNPDPGARIFSISLTAAAGIGKELFDKINGSYISYKDLIADFMGIVIGTLVFTLYE